MSPISLRPKRLAEVSSEGHCGVSPDRLCHFENLDKAHVLDDLVMKASREKTNDYVSVLLNWRKKNERKFAWRREDNPFHILIAEIMLQRTGARQVEPVYAEFVAKYPSVSDLANAPLEDIVKCLRPLGLKYRAIRLKQLAKTLEKEFGGNVPKNERVLLGLPGVGKYVANAVQCFAFKKDVPIVDANVLRILKRVFSVNSVGELSQGSRNMGFCCKTGSKRQGKRS